MTFRCIDTLKIGKAKIGKVLYSCFFGKTMINIIFISLRKKLKINRPNDQKHIDRASERLIISTQLDSYNNFFDIEKIFQVFQLINDVSQI